MTATAHGQQAFQGNPAFVNPAVGGCGFDHGVFAAHGIGGGGQAKFGFHAPDNVQIRECGLDHHDVGAFVDIERHFADGFIGIGGVHLVAAAVAEFRCGFGHLAERPVESRGEFRGIAHDGEVGKALVVQFGADGANAAIHHVAGRHHVRAGGRVAGGGFGEELEGGVVQNLAVMHDAAMAMRSVFAQADVGNDQERGQFFFQQAHGFLHDAVWGVSAAGFVVFFIGNAEQQNRRDAEGVGGGGFAHNFIG